MIPSVKRVLVKIPARPPTIPPKFFSEMRAALCLSAVLALAAAAPSVPHVALDAKVVDAQEAIINHANNVQSVRSGGFSPRGELEGTLASCGVFFVSFFPWVFFVVWPHACCRAGTPAPTP